MTKRSDKATPEDYRALGLQSGAQPEEVKHAFRNLVKQWHPDRYHQRSALEQHQAEERFKAISLAYRRIVASWEPEVRKSRAPRAHREAASTRSEADGRDTSTKASDNSAGGFEAAGRTRPISSRTGWSIPMGCLRSLASAPRRGLLFLAVLLAIVNWVPWERLSIPWAPRDTALKQDPGISAPQWPTQGQPGEAPADAHSPQDEERPLPSPTGKVRRLPITRLFPSRGHASFTIGSTQEEVLRAQGAPERIRGLTWVYGLSDVSFKDGKVVRYNNFGGELRVRMTPARVSSEVSSQWFTLGSTSDEVLRIQGTPTRVEGSKWFYGFSEVSLRNGRVDGFDNYFGSLKVKMLPASDLLRAESNSSFSIGSSTDEVLAIQGTPTSIRGNVWFYRFSNVVFRNGRVQNVVDTAGVLRFVLPDGNSQRK